MMEGTELRETLAHFGLTLCGPPQLLVGGADNENIRVATDIGTVVVRQYRWSAPDKVVAELRLVAYLARNGYPTPAPHRTMAGELMLGTDHPTAVFPFIAGEVPPALTEDLAEQCGELLGRLHELSTGWTDARMPRIDRVAVLQRAIDVPLPFGGVDEWRGAIARFLDDRQRELATLGQLPAGPLHHDLHRQNVLTADGRVVAVLDFDELNHGPLVIDLARTLFYLAVEQADRQLPQRLAEAVVAGYERSRVMPGLERELLPTAFELVALVDAANFLSWQADRTDISHIDECHSWLAYRRNTSVRVSDSRPPAATGSSDPSF